MTVKRPTSSAYGSPPRSEGHPHQAGSPNGSIAEDAAAMGVGARQIWGEWTKPPHSEVSQLDSVVVSAPLGGCGRQVVGIYGPIPWRFVPNGIVQPRQ